MKRTVIERNERSGQSRKRARKTDSLVLGLATGCTVITFMKTKLVENDQVWEKSEFRFSHVARDMPLVRRASEHALGKKPGWDGQKGRGQTSSTCLGSLGTKERALQGEASGEYRHMLLRAR